MSELSLMNTHSLQGVYERRIAELEAENEKLRAAIHWIEPPFIDANTPESELRKRIDFCVQDAKRAALKGGE